MDCDEINDIKEPSNSAVDVNSLLNSFNSLQTNEHDYLAEKFQSIANELSYTTARFFLEMNNWNLQAAVCCYFDFVASSNANALQPMPSMRIVKELTMGLGESVTPSTQFSQSWLIENNGRVPWPQGCYLKLVSEIDDDRRMEIPPVAPNDTYVLTVNLVSPAEIGQFRSQFRLCTPNETTVGPIIWSVVDVSPSGTLALTQQMNQLHTNNSALQVQQQHNQDEMAMQSSDAQNAPHCSSVPGAFANPNQTVLPAPQNSPNNTFDEEMMTDKVNTHNL